MWPLEFGFMSRELKIETVVSKGTREMVKTEWFSWDGGMENQDGRASAIILERL